MKTSETAILPLAVSIGEPAGIGSDVLLAAWAKARSGEMPPLPDMCVYADPDHLAARAQHLGIELETTEVGGRTLPQTALVISALKNRFSAAPGSAKSSDGAGVVEAISSGVDAIKQGKARGLVTLPINKKSLYDAGFDYPGHTEYLGALAKQWPDAGNTTPVMMLAGPDLRAVPVTIHIPLQDVPKALTTQSIVEAVTITHRDLKSRFGIANPRIAISGLNPHAGEEGSMGHEDIDIIAPAVQHLVQMGINCRGPLPADTMFHPAARATYDAAICMYHDQALIPAKALAFDESVNVTLGLPFVRTSPDHGTAFDIAGTGKANPSSFIAALRMADEMSSQRVQS